MRTQVRNLVAALGCMAGVFHANTAAAADQARHSPPGEVIPSEIYDPLGLVSRHGQLVSLAKGFSFTEGPAADRHGNVFFTDQPTTGFIVGTRGRARSLSSWKAPVARTE